MSGDAVETGRPALPWYWRWIEAWFARRLAVVPLTADPTILFAYNLYTHAGATVKLAETEIRPGDRVMELHFRREALLPLGEGGDSRRMGLGILMLADRDLPRLAEALRSNPELEDVRAVHALTLFHRGTQRYGFEVHPPASWLEGRWFTWWQSLLLARDHPNGRDRVEQSRNPLVARHVWASRERLLQRFPPERQTDLPAGP